MTQITITENDAGQRLDRFLRKYMSSAPLSAVYRMIRKDIKVNGKRVSRETMLNAGDVLSIYIKEEELRSFTDRKEVKRSAKRSFAAAYEDENILAAVKPAGLLVHGKAKEKKDTLVKQVTDYLIEKGAYVPRIEKSFAPAAANRLDRNTSGLVLFGKNAASLRALTEMIRRRGCVKKHYLALVKGTVKEELHMTGQLVKNAERNQVRVSEGGSESRDAETFARPLMSADGMTLLEVELVTGRTHQIRVHLSDAGFPIAGDPKYGDAEFNRNALRAYGLRGQFLHAGRISIESPSEPLIYLKGKSITAPLPDKMHRMASDIFGEEYLKRIWK